jgi:hypothetical protein
MKKTSTRRLTTFTLALAAMITLLFLTSYSQESAGDAESGSLHASRPYPTVEGARAIEGLWNTAVTIRNCQNGDPILTFRAMDLFNQGGTEVDTNNAVPSAMFPSVRPPGFGIWQYLGVRRFSVNIRFFLFNPDGTPAGHRRIVQDILLSENNDTWESTVATTNYDLNGNVTSTGCATASATRVVE